MRWIKWFACCMLACGLAFQGWGQMELLPIDSNYFNLNQPDSGLSLTIPPQDLIPITLDLTSSIVLVSDNSPPLILHPPNITFNWGELDLGGGFGPQDGSFPSDLLFDFFGDFPDAVVPESSSFAMVAGGLTVFLAVLPLNPVRKLGRLLRLGILAFK